MISITIDELTHSVVERLTGISYETQIKLASETETVCLVNEPDFFVNPQPLGPQQQALLSAHIQKAKEKMKPQALKLKEN